MAPFHFMLPAVLHLLWVILAIATAVGRSQRCQDAPPSQIHYVVLMWALFVIFCLSAVVELALVCVGFRGTILCCRQTQLKTAHPSSVALGLWTWEALYTWR